MPISNEITELIMIPDIKGNGLPLANVETIALTSALPSGWTYSRSDTVSTYRDSEGEMQVASANTPRFHHDIDGNPLGLLIEEGRTNLCTAKNYTAGASPSGFTTTGTAIVSGVFQSTVIEAGKFSNVSTDGFVIRLAGGASGGTVVIDGATGATGAFSVSMYARKVAGGGFTAKFGITPNAVATEITAADWTHVKAENLTATATTDKVTFTLQQFATIDIILFQLEAGRFSTTPILVNGATASRVKEFIQDPDLDTRDYWDVENGGIMLNVKPYQEKDTANVWGLFVAGSSEDSFPDNAYYLQMNTSSAKPHGYAKASNSLVGNGAVSASVLTDRYSGVGMSWTANDNLTVMAGAAIHKEIAMTGTPSGIDRFILGAFSNNAGQFNGLIKSITFLYGRQPSANQMASIYLGATDKAIIGGGQSNMENITQAVAADLYINNGERAFVDVLNDVWGTSTRNWLLNAAIGGTFITSWRGSGDSITKWKAQARAFLAAGGTIEAILWDQGESDMGVSKANFKLYYKEIFDDMRSVVGEVPVIIMPLGKYALANTQTHYDNCRAHREAYQELADENAYIYLGQEKIHRPLQSADIVHLDDYTEHGRATARKALDVLGETITGGVDGASIASAVRSGTTVTVTMTHDAGTDFTPTSGIEGFNFFDDGVEIPITAAVRTSATTIDLTLDSTPTGVEILDYAMGHLFSVTQSNLVRDNDTYPLALKSKRITPIVPVLLDSFEDTPYTTDFNWSAFRGSSSRTTSNVTDGVYSWRHVYTVPSGSQGFGIYATTYQGSSIDFSAYESLTLDITVDLNSTGAPIGLEIYDSSYNKVEAKINTTGTTTLTATFSDNPSFDKSNISEIYIAGFGSAGNYSWYFDNLKAL